MEKIRIRDNQDKLCQVSPCFKLTCAAAKIAAERYCTNAEEGHTKHLDDDYKHEKLQHLTDYTEQPKLKSGQSSSEVYLKTISERTESESTKFENVPNTQSIPESEVKAITKAVKKMVTALPNQLDPVHRSVLCPEQIQVSKQIECCKHIREISEPKAAASKPVVLSCQNGSVINISPIPLKVEPKTDCCKHQKKCSPKTSINKRRVTKPKSPRESKKAFNPSPVIVVPIMNIDLPDSSELKKDKRNRMLERLTVHNMPIVDIQRELVMQKVLHINIIPEIPPKDYTMASNNICYIECSSEKDDKQDLDGSSLRDIISRNISFIGEARKSSKSVPVKMPSKGEEVVKRIDNIAESIKTDLKILNQTRYRPELNKQIPNNPNMVEELYMNINQLPEENKIDEDYNKSDSSILVYTYSDEPKLNEKDEKTLDEEAKNKALSENAKWSDNEENVEQLSEVKEQSFKKDDVVKESHCKDGKITQSVEVSFTEPELKEYQKDDFTEIKSRATDYKDDDDDDDDEPDICICQGAYDPRTNRFPSTIYAVDELVCFCEEKIEAVNEKALENATKLESIVTRITDEIVESGKVKTTKKEKKSKGKSGCSKIFKHKNVEESDSDHYVLVHDVSAQVSIDSVSQKPVEPQAVKFHDHNFDMYGNENFDRLKNKMDKEPIDIIKRKSQYFFSAMGSMDPKQRASMIKRKSIVRRADHGSSSISSSTYPVQVELDSLEVEKIMGPKSIKSSDSAIMLDELMPRNNPVGDTISLQKYYKPCKDLKCTNEKPGRKSRVQRNIATETLATNTDRKDESISEGEVKLGGNLSNGECPSPKKNVSKASTKINSRKTERSESSRGRQVVHNKNWVSYYYPKASTSGVPHINPRSSK